MRDLRIYGKKRLLELFRAWLKKKPELRHERAGPPALRCKALRAGGGQVKYLLAYEQAQPKKGNPER